VRQKPRSIKQEDSEEDTEEDKENKNKKDDGNQIKVKKSECIEAINTELTDLTRTKFSKDNPKCSDLESAFAGIIKDVEGCGNWLKGESSIETELEN